MSAIIFFFVFIPLLSIILLSINFIFAPHRPYKEKKTAFECGYHSFNQTRSQFSISFFLFSYVFLLLDIEIILLYPYPLSILDNAIYGLFSMITFTTIVTVGFVFELGKDALKITSKQNVESPSDPVRTTNNEDSKVPEWVSSLVSKPSVPLPMVLTDLSYAENMQVIRELGMYFSWAVARLNEVIVSYDFQMHEKPQPQGLHNIFETYITPDRVYWHIPDTSPVNHLEWLPDWPADTNLPFMGVRPGTNPRGNDIYLIRLIKCVWVDSQTGLSDNFFPFHEGIIPVVPKVLYNQEGLERLSGYYELCRNIKGYHEAHVIHAKTLLAQEYASQHPTFFTRAFPTDWLAARDEGTSMQDFKDQVLEANTKIYRLQGNLADVRKEQINNSVILKEIAVKKMIYDNTQQFWVRPIGGRPLVPFVQISTP